MVSRCIRTSSHCRWSRSCYSSGPCSSSCGTRFVLTGSVRSSSLRPLFPFALSQLSGALFGAPNLWSPTWRAFSDLRSAQSVALYHSTNWRWILDAPHLLVPVLVGLMWSALVLRCNNGFLAAERFLASVLAFQLIASVYLQFFRDQWVLEFHYYFSLLWPPSSSSRPRPCANSVGRCRETSGGGDGSRPAWSSPFRRCWPRSTTGLVRVRRRVDHRRSCDPRHRCARSPRFACTWRGGRRRLPRRELPRHRCAIALESPPRRGQAGLLSRTTSWCSATRARPNAYSYLAASDLNDIVPPPAASGVPLLFWGPACWPQSLSVTAAEYGWLANAILGLPNLSPADVVGSTAYGPTSWCSCRRGNPTWTWCSPRCAPSSSCEGVSSARLHHGAATRSSRGSSRPGLRPPRTG